ncbi:MAG: tryptophan synthase alpha chain [Lentimonas sp.]|jgi:tryptophan synthase alpha chain
MKRVNRIATKFKELKKQKKVAMISYLTAGDPDYRAYADSLIELPKNGVDIVEIGIPFLDPAGDGVVIERSSRRAVKSGLRVEDVIGSALELRQNDNTTPIVIMGYYNSLFHYGINKFCADAQNAHIDGILIVDLPPEEDNELRLAAEKNNLNLIKLVSLTSSQERIKTIVENASGFIYLVSVLGVTGTKTAQIEEVKNHIKMIRKETKLPIVVGFGIKTRDQVKEMATTGTDGVVVGSSLIQVIEKFLKKTTYTNTKEIPNLIANKARKLFVESKKEEKK